MGFTLFVYGLFAAVLGLPLLFVGFDDEVEAQNDRRMSRLRRTVVYRYSLPWEGTSTSRSLRRIRALWLGGALCSLVVSAAVMASNPVEITITLRDLLITVAAGLLGYGAGRLFAYLTRPPSARSLP